MIIYYRYMNLDNIVIPVYVNNLPERKDRLESVKSTFEGRDEFELHIMQSIKKDRGADGLWESIKNVIRLVIEGDDEVVIICEDDHVFTSDYDRNLFLKNVVEAGRQGCQVLYGGIGNYHNAVPVSEHRFWIDWSWCAQFMVVYRPAFVVILNAKFGPNDVADEFLSVLLPNKMTFFPFISVQREFGYSDVTFSNNKAGTMTRYFVGTTKGLAMLKRIQKHYQCILKPPFRVPEQEIIDVR